MSLQVGVSDGPIASESVVLVLDTLAGWMS